MYNDSTATNDYWKNPDSVYEPINEQYVGCKIPADFDGYIVITHKPDFLKEDEFKI